MTIRWKYTAITAALMAGLVAAIGLAVNRVQRQVLNDQGQERLETLMAGVARVAEESVAAQDRFLLLSYLNFVQRQRPELKLAEVTRRGHTAVLGEDGPGLVYATRVVGQPPAKITITAPPRPDGLPSGSIEAGADGVTVRVEGDAQVEASRPESGDVLTLRFGFSKAALDAETERAVQALMSRTVAIAVGFLGLGLLVSAVVGHRMAEPLAALAAAADAVGQGRMDARVPDTARKDELGAVSRRFNAMADRLQELVAFREDLLHTLTHELNTPLAGLKGTLELWQDRRPPEDPSEYREAVGLMMSAVGRMEESLGSALSLFRGEAAKARPASLVWLNELVAEAKRLFDPVASAKQVRLECEAAPTSLLGDPELLRQVVVNLVSNAVKYTPAGGLARVEVSDLGDSIRLDVLDTGFGIAEEDLPHLFTKFFRAGEGGERRRIPGTGLGLSIVKKAVESSGGRIWVQSRLGAGTRFTVLLPKSPSLALKGEPV